MQTEVDAAVDAREATVRSRGTDPRRPPGGVRAWTLLRALEVLAWLAFFAFAAVFLALRYWVLPDIGRYREHIVAEFSRSIGMPVKIASIEADWEGLRPRVTLNDVRIHDREGREVLALPSIDNVISWRSLFALELRLHSLEIDGPKLALRRDRAGSLYVAGMKLEPNAGGEGRFTDWILDQREIAVRDAEIEWIDEQRGAPPLKLGALQFRLRNRGEEHAFGLTARPPAPLGLSLDLRAELVGASLARPADWSGRLYAQIGDTDLAAWRAWIDYPIDLSAGRGAVRMWATLGSGQLTGATADVALSGAVLRLRENLPLLELDQVSGRLLGRATARGYELAGRDLALAVVGGPALRPTSFRISWEPEADGSPQRGSASASLIELQPLAKLLAYLPVPADLNKRLAELAPSGELLEAKLDWTGPLTADARFSAKARFSGLSMSAREAMPGFSGLAGSFEATDRKGTVQLRASGAEIDLPKVFAEPRIPLAALSGRIDWARSGASGVEVSVSSLAFANEHLAGSAFGSYVYGATGPGLIDLSAQLTRADARYAARYLPLGSLMGEGARAWLARAVVAGEVSSARLRLTGDLRDFPYAKDSAGQFFVSAHVKAGVLDYAQGWPRIEDIEGELVFDRARVDFVGRSGRILRTSLAGVRVSVPNLLAPRTELVVTGQADGPTSEFLAYVGQSPLRKMIGGATDTISATGPGRLRLRLDLPLDELGKSKVAGDYEFSDNKVGVYPGVPPIERATGKVSFTESSLDLRAVTGRLLGGTVTIGGGMRSGAGLKIVARGEASASGLRPLLGAPWADSFSGASDYVASVEPHDGRVGVTLESSLRGMAIGLPPPLAKPAGESLPLRIVVRHRARAPETRISASLGRVLAAEIARAGEERDTAQRVSIAFTPRAGQALRLPAEPGVLVYGSLPELNLDRWLALVPREEGGSVRAAFELEFGVLDAYGKRLHEVSLQGRADAQGWSANLRGTELAGDLTYRSGGRGTLIGRMAHLRVPEDYPGAKPAEGSRDLPSVDLIAERFAVRDKELGRIEIAAEPSGLNWRIDKVSVRSPEASLEAKGLWRTAVPDPGGAVAVGPRTSLELALEATDAGKFLERVGYPGLLKGGDVKLNGAVAWDGDPVSIHYPSLTGELSLQADNGQFLKVDPEAGRLISLLNLQMLFKRFALDFSDVIEKGFQFEHVSSSLHIKQGVLSTQDFRMRGSAAEVEIRGEADLVRETQNVRVRVVPSLGGSASTVVGILGGPVVGVGTLLAQKLLKDPLGQIFAAEYSVTGTWVDPKVDKIVSAPTSREPPASPN